MPDISSAQDFGKDYTPALSVSNTRAYILIAVASSTATFASTVTLGTAITFTKREEATIGSFKVAVYDGIATGTQSAATSAIASGGTQGDFFGLLCRLENARTSTPLVLADYIDFQAHTPVASTTTDGIDMTPPVINGRFIQYVAAVTTGAGTEPNSTSQAGWQGVTGGSDINITGVNFIEGLHEVREQTADQASIAVIEHDLVWNAFTGTGASAVEVLIWLPPSGNSTPEVPTNLQRTGSSTDTTPVFSCDLDDFDFNFSEQVKARFSILQSDGVTEIATVDSSFISAAGTATAEYTTPLAIGEYFVRVKAVDDSAAESAYSSNVAFSVTSQITKDLQIIANAYSEITDDLELIWNVDANNPFTKDLELLHNTEQALPVEITKDLAILFDTEIGWLEIESSATTWEVLVPPSYPGD